jgi:tetratricopeptide (TPR) repeat protein
LEKAIAMNPDDAQAHFLLGQVLRALGQTAEAQAQLKIFAERQQATVKLALGQNKSAQASEALSSGNRVQAAALYREAIDAQPLDAALEYDLALALEQDGSVEEQRAALQKAIELKPGFAAAENQLGLVEARAGESAAAERHFRNALSAVPRYAEAANNLGTLLGQQGRDAEAEVRFRAAVSANPRFTAAWINLAATLASESRFDDARASVESALRIDPQSADALRLRQMLASAAARPASTTHAAGQSATTVPH